MPRLQPGDRPAHPPEKHWLFRGAQSALFWFISCGPCHVAAHQSRRKKQARRARCERQQEQSSNPDRYHHPSPFDINPYWNEEMEMGPGPPQRRVKKRATNMSATTDRSMSIGMRTMTTSTTGSRTEMMEVVRPESVHLGRPGWNLRRYQRADEELFLTDATDTDGEQCGALDGPDDTSENASRLGPVRQGNAMGSSVGMGGVPPHSTCELAHPHLHRVVSRPTPTSSFYTTSTPTVPELLQPVVTPRLAEYANKSDTALRWLKEPPPSAAFMEGKEPRNRSRSRSGSEASRRRGRTENGRVYASEGGRASSFSFANASTSTLTKDLAARILYEKAQRSSTATGTATTTSRGSRISLDQGLHAQFQSITKTRSATTISTNSTATPSPTPSKMFGTAQRAKWKPAPRTVSGSSATTSSSTDSLSSLDNLFDAPLTSASIKRRKSRTGVTAAVTHHEHPDRPFHAPPGGFAFASPHHPLRPSTSRKQLSTIMSSGETSPANNGTPSSQYPHRNSSANDPAMMKSGGGNGQSRRPRQDSAYARAMCKGKSNANANRPPTLARSVTGYDGANDQSLREWDAVMALDGAADADEEPDSTTERGGRAIGMERTTVDGRWRWSTGF
ncbi:hypothetical protein P152DRAFT_451124 [Eremomyces bilateralis CBS 781.70]|uniref:Uncharacterized protein n=1 Tax=Eremomyces bilateralis CBS 781.70 TaxID=1392243 RepID=A0A6G1FXG7_9PEZI|nr:uncharacterized protein P152DRAFT_451124 [Eremomyces bilateralis CBS 781.70]KAF1810371.1 hypothetical protein P152DRAFT_451124 [Eremomyces bilateralis CBS 781.70]